ncbi:MAG: methionine adenosyltransferase [Candidatus Methanodesulfokora washburnensis]|jgi:S-adenosylmethionine synthetase
MRNIMVEEVPRIPMDEQPVEIVERKGIGHPDTICDSIMEEVSVELNKEYLRRVGGILHYNADKSLLVAGEAEVKFGGGKVKRPMLLVIGDRATNLYAGEEIPIEEIAIRAAKRWIKENLRYVDPEEHVQYMVELRPGSAELTDIFRRSEGKLMGANDTSAAVGYAPLSRMERLVLEVEKMLNSREFKRSFPEVGEDIKVMGYRVKNSVNLTIAVAFVDRYIGSEEEYFKRKEEVLEAVNSYLKNFPEFESIKVEMNTLDVRGRGENGVYLTVLGTSADSADSGEVGRGNGVNGLIPLMRPRSSEAAAGKNPVSHVGKIYNILTHKIAERVVEEVPEVREVFIWLVSRIGKPVDQPDMAAAEVVMKRQGSLQDVKERISDIINRELERMPQFIDKLIENKLYPY